MKSKNLTNILLVISIGIFLFGSGYKFGEYKARIGGITGNLFGAEANSSAKNRNMDFSLFWEAWDQLQSKYVDQKKIDPKKMYYGAIKGMVASVEDPYTFFLTPDENKQSKDDLGGRFEGIGAQLGLKDNRIVIIAPLKNSPAEKAGIQPGDFVMKVDGQDATTMSLPQAVTKIRGPKGSQVKLTLERKNKEFDVTLTRDQIKVSSVELSYEQAADCTTNCAKVAYLKLNQFGETTNAEWDKATDEIQDKWNNKEIKGMVLDLRDNPGGFLDSAVHLASEFIDEGKVVVKQESTVSESRTYYVERAGKLKDIPLVVLINKGSASASEILSGALRDYKRATLIGEKSFGKGSVQEPIDLDGGAGIHITVAKWILPNGDWINGKGIEPAIKVTNQADENNTMTKENDKQLQTAINEVTK